MQAKLIIFGLILTVGSLIPLYKPIGINKISHKHLRVFAGSAGIIFLLCAAFAPLQDHFTFIMLIWLLLISSDIYYLERKSKIIKRKNEKARLKHDQKRNTKKKSASADPRKS